MSLILWPFLNIFILTLFLAFGSGEGNDVITTPLREFPFLFCTSFLIVSLFLFLESSLFRILSVCCARLTQYKKLASGGIALIGTPYIIAVGVCWIVRLRYGAFPQVVDLPLIEYLFEGVTLQLYLTNEDILLVLAAFCLIFLILARASFLMMQGSFGREIQRQSLIHFICILLCNVIIATCSRMFLSQSTYIQLTQIVSNITLPQGAFGTALFYAPGLKTYKKVDLALKPLQGEEKLKKIDNQPNVIIIVAEAIRRDLINAHNEKGEITPVLNELARKGKYFAASYANDSDTEYSLLTLLSGQYPLKFPWRNQEKDTTYPRRFLPSYFQLKGYRTSYFTVFDWISSPLRILRTGLQYISEPTFDGGAEALKKNLALQNNLSPDDVDIQRIVAMLDEVNVQRFSEWLRKEPRVPFFSLFYLYSSHFPYQVPAENGESISVDNGSNEQSYFFASHEADLYKHKYEQAARHVDAVIGKLITNLKNQGVYERTRIVVTGDHGEQFYEHGGCLHAGPLHAEIMNVPLIFLNFPTTCVLEDTGAPVGHIDVAPTILDSLEIPPYLGFQGVSLCKPIDEKRLLFASAQALTHEDAVISKTHKLISNYRGAGKRFFDIGKDPLERNNLTHNSSLEDEMFKQYDKALQQYRDQQLTYYSMPPSERDKNYPPAVPSFPLSK